MFSACNSYPLRGGVGVKVRLLTHPYLHTSHPVRQPHPYAAAGSTGTGPPLLSLIGRYSLSAVLPLMPVSVNKRGHCITVNRLTRAVSAITPPLRNTLRCQPGNLPVEHRAGAHIVKR